MRWFRFLVLPVAFLAACGFISDFDKIGSVNWEPELGIPIAGGVFTIEDYVDAVSSEVTISQDAEGVVVFEYTGAEIASDKAEDLINIPDQSFNDIIAFNAIETTDFPISITITKQLSFSFDLDTEDGDLLDSMVFKSGLLKIDVRGDLPVSGQLQISFNPITVDSNTLTSTYNWTYNPGFPRQLFRESIDLTDASIDFTANGTTTSNFNFDVDLTINYAGQAISPANSVDINVSISNPRFAVVYGKFAQREFTTPKESVLLGILEEAEALDFFLDNPQIDLNFKSSFGIPVSVGLSSLQAIDSDGDSLAFTGSIIANPTIVAGPTLDQIGSFIETSISINSGNSNITDIISFLPSELIYQFDGTVESSSTEQFVLDTSQVIGSYKIKLPLSGHASNFTGSQEFDFDGTDLDPLKKTKIILHTTNGLPLTVGMELVFLDVNGVPLDTLFAGNNLLNSGIIDINGIVTSPSESIVEASLTEAEIEVLKAAKKIMLLSSLFTGSSGTENVKIRLQDQVKVSVYIQAVLSF